MIGLRYETSPARFCTQLSVPTNTTAACHIIIIIIMSSVLRQALRKRVLHRVRSSASSFTFQCLLVSLRSSRSCLCVLLRVLIPSTFYSILYFRSQFPRKMRPIQTVFRRCTVSRIFLYSLTLCNTSFFTISVQLIFSIPLPEPNFKTPKVFLFQNPTGLPSFGE